MATAHVFEYSTTAPGSYGEATNLFQEPASVAQSPITFSTAAQSAAFVQPWIVVQADAAFRVAFGEDPTATANSLYGAANTPYRFKVVVGHKLSIVAA